MADKDEITYKDGVLHLGGRYNNDLYEDWYKYRSFRKANQEDMDIHDELGEKYARTSEDNN